MSQGGELPRRNLQSLRSSASDLGCITLGNYWVCWLVSLGLFYQKFRWRKLISILYFLFDITWERSLRSVNLSDNILFRLLNHLFVHKLLLFLHLLINSLSKNLKQLFTFPNTADIVPLLKLSSYCFSSLNGLVD